MLLPPSDGITNISMLSTVVSTTEHRTIDGTPTPDRRGVQYFHFENGPGDSPPAVGADGTIGSQ